MDGILIIDKEKGWTSFDVVAKIRNKFSVKKVGHTGTLDPMATGVLVLCLGKATKLSQKLTAYDKEYLAEITLGATSPTDDAEGEITQCTNLKKRTESEIQSVLDEFKGEIMQIPPKFSAKKIKGKRAYALARQGKEVKLEARKVKVKAIQLLEYSWPIVKLHIACGKGFYVRSLARDIGEKLQTGAYLSALRRTRVGNFSISEAKTIEKVKEENLLKI